jgi:small subunit ribosomal protein S7
MSRRISIKKRLPFKNLKYNSILLTILINKILRCGKKLLAQKIIYKALDYIKNKLNQNPLLILEKVIHKISPKIQLKVKLIGGTTYQIPEVLNKFTSLNLGVRWLIEFSKKRAGNKIYLKLAHEIIDSYKGIGNTLKKKEETHRLAESNQLFL